MLGWGRLWDWVAAAPSGLPLQRTLTHAAVDWEAHGQLPGQLWDNDPRLRQLGPNPDDPHAGLLRRGAVGIERAFRGYAIPAIDWLNELETTFVKASYARKLRNLRALAGVVAALLVLAIGTSATAVVAWQAKSEAVKQRNNAVQQQATAVAASTLAIAASTAAAMATQKDIEDIRRADNAEQDRDPPRRHWPRRSSD